MGKKRKVKQQVHRSSVSGRFVTAKHAKRSPRTTETETIKVRR